MVCMVLVISLFSVHQVQAESGITGSVTAPNGAPVPGVMIGLYNQSELLLQQTSTDITGAYQFVGLVAGVYDLDCILPLGFDFADGSVHLIDNVDVQPDQTVANQDWDMVPVAFYHLARSAGFWKHQFKANLSGNGTGNIYYPLHELVGSAPSFADDIYSHYYGAIIDPIRVEGVTYVNALQMDEYDFEATLTYKGNDIHQKACKQYLALLLNIVSGKLPQFIQFTQDGLYVTQVVYYINQLLTEVSTDYDPELAMDIAETMNHGEEIPAGVIPQDTPFYLYSYGEEVSLATMDYTYTLRSPSPNPFNPTTMLTYELADAAEVTLAVYDIGGRQVALLADGWSDAGIHELTFDASSLPSGVYFVRLSSGELNSTQKLLLIK